MTPPPPPIGARIEVSFDGHWATAVVTSHDPRGFEVQFDGGGSAHSANPRFFWRPTPPAPPTCEICSRTTEHLIGLTFPGDPSLLEPPVSIEVCADCAATINKGRRRWVS
jgi:hypothetical protein